MPRFTGWQLVALAAIIVPSGAWLVYNLVQQGQTVGAIAAAVISILAGMGWQSSRFHARLQQAQTGIEKVEKLANGNLSRADEQRALAQQQSIEQLHAVYQQFLAVTAAAPSGTPVPPLPAVATKAPADS